MNLEKFIGSKYKYYKIVSIVEYGSIVRVILDTDVSRKTHYVDKGD